MVLIKPWAHACPWGWGLCTVSKSEDARACVILEENLEFSCNSLLNAAAGFVVMHCCTQVEMLTRREEKKGRKGT